jgi:hypothetical protein
MDIERNRELQLKSIIRSNLVSCGLLPEQIDEITLHLYQDIIDAMVMCE